MRDFQMIDFLNSLQRNNVEEVNKFARDYGPLNAQFGGVTWDLPENANQFISTSISNNNAQAYAKVLREKLKAFGGNEQTIKVKKTNTGWQIEIDKNVIWQHVGRILMKIELDKYHQAVLTLENGILKKEKPPQVAIDSFNARIEGILEQAKKGYQRENLPPYPEWFLENKEKVESWIASPHLRPEIKQQLQSILHPEEKFQASASQEEQELERIYQILRDVIPEGDQAVVKHAGTPRIPGTQVRVEFNFPPHNQNGTFNAEHFSAIKNALAELGVIDPFSSVSFHGASPFIVIKPTPDGRVFNDPNFESKFRASYQAKIRMEQERQESRKEQELDKIFAVLSSVIKEGKSAVTKHSGSASSPGKQVRVEFNFPPHNVNQTYNSEEYAAIKKTLVDLGLVPDELSHGPSPFMVIKPTESNWVLSNPHFEENFRKAYAMNTSPVRGLIQTEVNGVQENLKYANNPIKNTISQKRCEDVANQAILKIISLVKDGQPNWFQENPAILNEWLKDERVKHSVKQQLQSLFRPEDYYSRTYSPQNQLVSFVYQKLQEAERDMYQRFLSTGGGYNLSLELDSLLKKLEAMDKGFLLNSPASIQKLFEYEQDVNANPLLKMMLEELVKNPDYKAHVVDEKIAIIKRDIEGALKYLGDDERMLHNTRGIKSQQDILNTSIPTFIDHIKANPNKMGEMNPLLERLMASKDLTEANKHNLRELMAVAKASVKPPAEAEPALPRRPLP